MPQGEDPTNWAPDDKPYNTVPRGSLTPLSELPDSWDRSPKNSENYRAVTLALTARIPFAFRWLVGNAKCAMGIVCGAHGHEWGDLLRYGRGPRPGDAIEILMPAWMTWRQISVPRTIRPAVERAISHPSPHQYQAHMKVRLWRKRPRTSRLQLGPALTRRDDQANPTPA